MCFKFDVSCVPGLLTESPLIVVAAEACAGALTEANVCAYFLQLGQVALSHKANQLLILTPVLLQQTLASYFQKCIC